MSSSARREYGEQLRLRKRGVAGSLSPEASLIDAKPHFYADARLLTDEVRKVHSKFRTSAPPYGLVDHLGHPIDTITKGSWTGLEQMLAATAQHAFEVVTPPQTGCPYHETLRNLGSIPLRPVNPSSPDKEHLRSLVFPGAMFAPATIVNILKRMPTIARLNRATVDSETLARNSAHTLLHEPLHHPQQLAKAFTFTLADGAGGTDGALNRNMFMPEDVITAYTELGENAVGHEAIVWSKPTEDFTLRANVRVANRLAGSERDQSGEHITMYPIGTRLGDIVLDEPTIGCPGSLFAYDMWEQAIDVIVGEGFWEEPKTS